MKPVWQPHMLVRVISIGLMAASGCSRSETPADRGRAGGAGSRKISDTERTTRDSEWTPESADLVFMSNRDGNAEIYLLPAGATEWKNLTNHPAADNWPEWSPDGTRIAFQSERSGNLDIWLMDADGGNVVQLTNSADQDYMPQWSPDGATLTFESWRTEPGDAVPVNHIYIMNADGSEQRRLFRETLGTSTTAVFAPEPNTFLVSRTVGGGGEEEGKTDIFVVDASGAVIRQLTDDASYDGSAVYSPDGSQIAFYAESGMGATIELMRSDGGARRTLVSEGSNWYPRWSPDGRWLVYTATVTEDSGEDLAIRAIAVDGNSLPRTLVVGPGREAEGRWRPMLRSHEGDS